jgi:hypothetical protein
MLIIGHYLSRPDFLADAVLIISLKTLLGSPHVQLVWPETAERT